MNKINDRYIKIETMELFGKLMDLGEPVVFLHDGSFDEVDDDLLWIDINRLIKEGHYYHDTKPKKQVVDMEPFVRNGLDCEFCDHNTEDQWHRIGKLHEIINTSKTPFWLDKIGNYCYCRPRLNHPFIWEGQELPEGLEVSYGHTTNSKLWWTKAVRTHMSTAVVARITGTKDGYCFPGDE